MNMSPIINCGSKDYPHRRWFERLYGDMAGFGFLDKYIADPDIEEINGNSWRDIEIVTRSGWRKIPERFLSPQHAEDTLRKMVRLGGLVLDGTNPIVDSYITQGIRISAMIPPVTDRRSGAVFSIRRQRMAKVSKSSSSWNGRQLRRKCWTF